jgi:hypothetical protein
MTDGRTVTVDAQWALHGQGPGREGYRVLACSAGELSARNFADAIGRFSPGTSGELPQVSVSYVQTAGLTGGSYLALALHRHPDELRGDGDRQSRYDDSGRGIAYTSYFCLPYQPLATDAVSYQAMYRALDPIRLPQRDGPPIAVTLAANALLTPAVDDLALQAAALLLTARPVCVVGARDTTAAERLAFIDTVMSLLPFGLRATTAAATWTRPTYRDHRFRLFFSEVARATEPPDHLLAWGHPEETAITPANNPAYEYLTWLRDRVSQPVALLARLPQLMRYKNEEIQTVLGEIGVFGPDPSADNAATGPDLTHPAPADRTAPGQGQSYGEQILRTCARHVLAGDQVRIKSDIRQLKLMADADIGDAERTRYRHLLTETGLLKQDERLGRNAIRLYEQLLRLAFTAPLGYEEYCRVEDCLGGRPGDSPHEELLRAIRRCGISDTKLTAIVYWQLRARDETRFDKWYASQEIDGVQLIHLLAGKWDRSHHARVLCDVTRDYLVKMAAHNQPDEIQVALRQHGFLGHALEANHVGYDQYQVNALCDFLKAAYPNGLDGPAIIEVLTSSYLPPTPALLVATLLLLARPSDARLASEAYTHSVIAGMNLMPETHRRLLSQPSPSV